MKTRLLLILSLAANLVLAAAVAFLSGTFARLPDSTMATVVYNLMTNAPIVGENVAKTNEAH
jgi:hypothetical protein